MRALLALPLAGCLTGAHTAVVPSSRPAEPVDRPGVPVEARACTTWVWFFLPSRSPDYRTPDRLLSQITAGGSRTVVSLVVDDRTFVHPLGVTRCLRVSGLAI